MKKFVEKPDIATATRYTREGYLWNSGTFSSVQTSCFQRLKRLEPEIAVAIGEAVARASNDLGFVRLQPEAFVRAPQNRSTMP